MLLFLFILSSHAQVVFTSLGGYEEVLLGGAGAARIGSTGSVASNPGLMGYLPKDEAFTSTNLILFVRDRELSDDDAQVDPTFLPIYAVSTSREGDWGQGFGITSLDMRIRFEELGPLSFEGESRTTGISVYYALGRKWKDFGLGLNVALNRGVQESSYRFDGNEGTDFLIGSSRTDSVIWNSTVVLGAAGVFGSNWSWGGSIYLMPVVWNATGREKQRIYSVNNAQVYDINSTPAPVVARPVRINGGTRFSINPDSLVNVELEWNSPETTAETKQAAVSAIMLGLEQRLSDKLWGYGGLNLREAIHFKQNAESNNALASFGTSLGIKRIHRNASTLYGVTYSRGVEYVQEESIGIIFGTRFLY